MSRCFPYLAPRDGREGVVAFEESLVEEIKLQKGKERRKEKKDSKREKKKEKKEKSRKDHEISEDAEPSKKKRKCNEGEQIIQSNHNPTKNREEGAEQLEESSLTEENGPPSALQNPYDSDRSQNSDQRGKLVPAINVGYKNKGLVFRFKLSLKRKDPEPAGHNDAKPPAPNEGSCFSGRSEQVEAETYDKPPCFKRSCIYVSNCDAAENVCRRSSANPTSTLSSQVETPSKPDTIETVCQPSSNKQRSASTGRVKMPSKQETIGTVCQPSRSNQRSAASTVRVGVPLKGEAIEASCQPSNCDSSLVEISVRREAIEAAVQPSYPGQSYAPTYKKAEISCKEAAGIADKPSSSNRRCLPASRVQMPFMRDAVDTANRPSSSNQWCITADKKAETTSSEVEITNGPSGSNQRCNLAGKTEAPCRLEPPEIADNPSSTKKKSSQAERKEQKFKDLVLNWNPPPLLFASADEIDQGWLSKSGDESSKAGVKISEVDPEFLLGHRDGVPSLMPQAGYVPDINVYVLPYVVPY